MTHSNLRAIALTLSISIVALNAISNAQAETHCTDVPQTKCTTANLCKWTKGWNKGDAKKSGKGNYARNRKPSCRKDNKAINTFLMSKFPNLAAK